MGAPVIYDRPPEVEGREVIGVLFRENTGNWNTGGGAKGEPENEQDWRMHEFRRE